MKKGAQCLVRLWVPEAAHFTLGNTVLIHLPSDTEAGLCAGSEQGGEVVVTMLSSGARLTGYPCSIIYGSVTLVGMALVPTSRLQGLSTSKARRTVPGTW